MPKFTMSDARVFTDYNPNCEMNRFLQKKYNVENSHEYRKFLQDNAEKVMIDNKKCDLVEDCKLCPVCKKAVE